MERSYIRIHTVKTWNWNLRHNLFPPYFIIADSSLITLLIYWEASTLRVSLKCNHFIGKGAVYSFDPVGSFERESYRAGGSAASLIQPFLDSVVGFKNRTAGPVDLTVEGAVKIAKDAFSAAAERDIKTGDSLDIWILRQNNAVRERFQLRKD